MKKLGLRRNLELEVYDIVKSLILDRKYMPGDKISIDQLIGELGVSRTPIVIGLKMLEREMLITTKPRRGHYIRTFTKREIIDVLDLRGAGSTGCQKGCPQYHRISNDGTSGILQRYRCRR